MDMVLFQFAFLPIHWQGLLKGITIWGYSRNITGDVVYFDILYYKGKFSALI